MPARRIFVFCTTLLFAVAFYISLICGALIDIFVFNHWDGSLGPDTTFTLTSFFFLPISAICAVGFATVLAYRGRSLGELWLARRWVIGSGVLATVLLYAFEYVDSTFNRVFPIKATGLLVFCFVLGVFIAFAVLKFSRSK